jgi:hypothetical protein
VLFIDSVAGEQAQLSDDDYIEGAPELIVEIAALTIRKMLIVVMEYKNISSGKSTKINLIGLSYLKVNIDNSNRIKKVSCDRAFSQGCG